MSWLGTADPDATEGKLLMNNRNAEFLIEKGDDESKYSLQMWWFSKFNEN